MSESERKKESQRIKEQKERCEERMKYFDKLHPNCRKYIRVNGWSGFDCAARTCNHPNMIINENYNE